MNNVQYQMMKNIWQHFVANLRNYKYINSRAKKNNKNYLIGKYRNK